MKKLIVLILGCMALCGATTMVNVRAEEDSVINGEPTSEVIEETIVEEEKDDLQKALDELTEKYNEAKAKIEDFTNREIFGTTVGAIIGMGVSLIVSLLFSLVNRSNIKTAISLNGESRTQCLNANALISHVEEEYKNVVSNYNNVVIKLENLQEIYDNQVKQLEKLAKNEEKLTKIANALVVEASNTDELAKKGLITTISKILEE